MKKLTLLALALSVALPYGAIAQDTTDDLMSSDTFNGLKVRNIGPAYMSGCVADIAVDQNDPDYDCRQ